MNRFILNQAFITMGYRQLTNFDLGNIYCKPVGFSVITAKVAINHKEVVFRLLFHNYSKPSEILAFSEHKMDIDFTDEKLGYEHLSNNELYDLYCKGIAYSEIELNLGDALSAGAKDETFAFRSKNDVMSMLCL